MAWNAFQKPARGVSINFSHPLSRGIVGCWVLNELNGKIVNDLANPGRYGLISQGASWARDGISFASSTADEINLGIYETYWQTLTWTGISVELITIPFDTSNVGILAEHGVVFRDDIFYISENETSGYYIVNFSDTTLSCARRSSSQFIAGKRYSVIGTLKLPGSAPNLYINGVLSNGTQPSSDVLNNINGGSNYLSLGRRPGATNASSKSIINLFRI